MRENRTSGSMRRGERRVMVHSANGHRTRKGGNGGAPPDLYTTALALHSTRAVKRCSALAGASPAWGNCRFAPVATETARRITDLSKLSGHRSTMGGSASRRAATRVKPEQASKGKS